MNIYPNQYKHCTKCNTTKSIDNFSKKSANKDGYRNHCKDCIKVYRQNNKERIIEYEKNYRQNNKEYYREYEKNRYKTNSFYNLKKSIRTAIHAGFRYNGFTKKSKSFEILGCSFDEFYIYYRKSIFRWYDLGQ